MLPRASDLDAHFFAQAGGHAVAHLVFADEQRVGAGHVVHHPRVAVPVHHRLHTVTPDAGVVEPALRVAVHPAVVAFTGHGFHLGGAELHRGVGHGRRLEILGGGADRLLLDGDADGAVELQPDALDAGEGVLDGIHAAAYQVGNAAPGLAPPAVVGDVDRQGLGDRVGALAGHQVDDVHHAGHLARADVERVLEARQYLGALDQQLDVGRDLVAGLADHHADQELQRDPGRFGQERAGVADQLHRGRQALGGDGRGQCALAAQVALDLLHVGGDDAARDEPHHVLLGVLAGDVQFQTVRGGDRQEVVQVVGDAQGGLVAVGVQAGLHRAVLFGGPAGAADPYLARVLGLHLGRAVFALDRRGDRRRVAAERGAVEVHDAPFRQVRQLGFELAVLDDGRLQAEAFTVGQAVVQHGVLRVGVVGPEGARERDLHGQRLARGGLFAVLERDVDAGAGQSEGGLGLVGARGRAHHQLGFGLDGAGRHRDRNAVEADRAAGAGGPYHGCGTAGLLGLIVGACAGGQQAGRGNDAHDSAPCVLPVQNATYLGVKGSDCVILKHKNVFYSICYMIETWI